jgi:NAD(P)-dependent dehydrogenase (short-subunit alcohol dehydrogenase family)
VTNIDEVFAHVKSLDALHLINDSPEYRPFFISAVKPRDIELPGANPDMAGAKEAICEIVKGVRFFYAIDRYGIEWEFERAVLGEMVKARRGSIINIGSSWSTRASVFNQDGGGVDYCSSKAALHALTRATAQDVAPKNIRVNTIAPGAVDTPMHADHRALLFEFEKYIPLGRIR